VLRRFRGFWHAAEENAVSRIYVGFHFRDAIEEGMEHGRRIGDWAVEHAMRPVRRR
jgi:hypothetical protein